MRNDRTLGGIAQIEATFFDIECQGRQRFECWHTAKLSLIHAIALLGPRRGLNSIRFRCTHCGLTEVLLRCRYPPVRGAGHMHALEHHENVYHYRWRHIDRHGYAPPAQNRLELSCGHERGARVCPVCRGERWVCESHRDRPWNEKLPGGCECGARAMPRM